MKSYVIALLLASTSGVQLNSKTSSDLSQTGGPNTPAPGAAKGEDRFVLPVHSGLKGFDIRSLEHCPDFNERHVLLNGVTKAVAYPNAGYNCNADFGLAQQKGGPGTGGVDGLYVNHVHSGLKGFDTSKLEHCPDFNERHSLLNGVTKAVPYPQAGFNCNKDYGLVQGGPNTPAPGAAKGEDRFVLPVHSGLKGFDIRSLEHCPDFNERHVLLNGVTKAVAYPNAGYNCNADFGLAQVAGGPGTGSVGGLYVNHAPSGLKGFDISSLEHCPDFNERHSLLNGVTKAVAYPNAGYNCNADFGLAQVAGGPGTGSVGGLYVNHVHSGLKGFDIQSLEHCPDFNERHVLLNGVTKAVAYPNAGYNCNADFGLSQVAGGPGTGSVGGLYVNHAPSGLKGFDISSLEHCPDFNERHSLLNGVTKAVAYPNAGYNCNADFGLAQKQGGPNTAAPGAGNGEDRYVLHKHSDTGAIANMEHCPNFNERMTLLDGKTRAVSYPNTGFNCKNEH